jgi:hypothetical protein
VTWISLRQKYEGSFMPAGAVGVSLLLGAAEPGGAAQQPMGSQLSAAAIGTMAAGTIGEQRSSSTRGRIPCYKSLGVGHASLR